MTVRFDRKQTVNNNKKILKVIVKRQSEKLLSGFTIILSLNFRHKSSFFGVTNSVLLNL